MPGAYGDTAGEAACAPLRGLLVLARRSTRTHLRCVRPPSAADQDVGLRASLGGGGSPRHSSLLEAHLAAADNVAGAPAATRWPSVSRNASHQPLTRLGPDGRAQRGP